MGENQVEDLSFDVGPDAVVTWDSRIGLIRRQRRQVGYRHLHREPPPFLGRRRDDGHRAAAGQETTHLLCRGNRGR